MSACCCQPAGTAASGGTSAASLPSTLWLKIGGSIVLAGLSMIFSLGVNLDPPAEPVRTSIHILLALSVLGVAGLIGIPLFRESWNQIRQLRPGVELLFLCGILGAFAASLYSTITATGDIYYEVVAILLVIYVTGKTVGSVQKAKAFSALTEATRQFQSARIADGTVVPVETINSGDRVHIFPDEAITVDGRVVEGTAFVDEAHLTGEPFSVVKRPGDPVRAGARCLDARLVIEATAPGSQREWDRILQEIEHARLSRSAIQARADRIAQWFLPVVLSLSLGTLAFWMWQDGWESALFHSLAVLVVACPCALGLATPIGLWSAINRLLDRNVCCRSGELIERLAGVDTIVFDKTGTLSESRPQLLDFCVVEPSRRESLMRRVSSLEGLFPHPFARLFSDWPGGDPPGSHQPIPGTGVRGGWPDSTLEIGNHRLLNKTDQTVLASLREQSPVDNHFRELVVKENDRLVGLALYRESLRPSALDTLKQLSASGLHCACCTGDHMSNVDPLTLPDGVEVLASLSPEEKLAFVREQQASGRRVAFIGDGANDAAAMQAADLALAMESGHELAKESAHGLLLGDRLDSLLEAREICLDTVQRLRQNLWFATAYNGVGISLAMAGILHPVHAALLMLASSATVSWRALQHAEKASDHQTEEGKCPEQTIPIRQNATC